MPTVCMRLTYNSDGESALGEDAMRSGRPYARMPAAMSKYEMLHAMVTEKPMKRGGRWRRGRPRKGILRASEEEAQACGTVGDIWRCGRYAGVQRPGVWGSRLCSGGELDPLLAKLAAPATGRGSSRAHFWHPPKYAWQATPHVFSSIKHSYEETATIAPKSAPCFDRDGSINISTVHTPGVNHTTRLGSMSLEDDTSNDELMEDADDEADPRTLVPEESQQDKTVNYARSQVHDRLTTAQQYEQAIEPSSFHYRQDFKQEDVPAVSESSPRNETETAHERGFRQVQKGARFPLRGGLDGPAGGVVPGDGRFEQGGSEVSGRGGLWGGVWFRGAALV